MTVYGTAGGMMGWDEVTDAMIWAAGITLRGVEPAKDTDVSLPVTVPLGVVAMAITTAH